MKWFYCGKVSANGKLIVNQKGVQRISQEMCEARCDSRRCPQKWTDPEVCNIYKREVIDADKEEV